MYEFNDDGPVYGPNGMLEVDPDNQQCHPPTSDIAGQRAVFATCKNNCPGGEFAEIECFSLYQSHQKLNIFKYQFILFSVNFPVVGGEAV